MDVNEHDTKLIARSIQILSEKNIEQVGQAGFRRDPAKYHITVMYPPLKAMHAMDEDQVYSRFQNYSKEFSLYIHIPFCSGKCLFCYFYQIEKPVNDVINRYLAALKKEMAMVKEKIARQFGHLNIQSIFFGGGSPTVLSEVQFKGLIGFVKETFDFSEQTEVTVEIHPEIVRHHGQSLLESYLAHGVNRLNIGVQSFDDHILKMTNRRHTAEEALETYRMARAVGFENINIDLLYPLPDLTPQIWEQTINTAFALEPESVTTYFTAVKEATPMYKFYQKKPQRFPDEQTNHLLRIMIMEKAKEAGYNGNELIDWFVKPKKGFHYEHQKNEARRSEEIQLLSFGSGVFSYFNHHQYYNYPDINKYCTSIDQGKLPIWKGIKLSKEERMARAMVLGIKSGVVNIQHFENTFRVDVTRKYHALLENLQGLGLLTQVNGDLKLTEKGYLFADEIAIQFASQEVKNTLNKKQYLLDSESEIINTYNFMGDIEELILV